MQTQGKKSLILLLSLTTPLPLLLSPPLHTTSSLSLLLMLPLPKMLHLVLSLSLPLPPAWFLTLFLSVPLAVSLSVYAPLLLSLPGGLATDPQLIMVTVYMVGK